MIPRPALLVLAGIPLVLAVASIAIPPLLAAMIAVDLVLFAVAGLDLLLSGGQVTAQRELPAMQAVGSWFPVALRIENVGRRLLTLRVTDDAPGETESLPATLALQPSEGGRLSYRARVDRRGAHAFGPVTVRWRSPLGLWERQRRIEVPGALRVYPDFAQLRRYGLRARTDEQRLPVRVRRRPGGENEFERLRPYVPGDPYRHIDWRATARRGEFVTREYGQEANQNLILMIDSGRMMSGPYGALTAFDHALNAALMLGQVALRHGDRVGLLCFDREVRAWLPPKGGARSGSRLIRATYDLFPTRHEPDFALAFRHLAQRVRRRSLVVLITTVVDEVNAELSTQLVRALGSRHLPVCVWLQDPDVDALLDAPAKTPLDLHVRGAAAELVSWRERELQALRRRGALVVDCPTDQLTPQLLSGYLEVKARRLL